MPRPHPPLRLKYQAEPQKLVPSDFINSLSSVPLGLPRRDGLRPPAKVRLGQWRRSAQSAMGCRKNRAQIAASGASFKKLFKATFFKMSPARQPGEHTGGRRVWHHTVLGRSPAGAHGASR